MYLVGCGMMVCVNNVGDAVQRWNKNGALIARRGKEYTGILKGHTNILSSQSHS